tara:strand:+ start:43762 stop:44373 length:612 start_codon:yes stop_codon:yes gene_type:complete
MKIICVGRNYEDHAKELQNNIPSEPLLFLKPETAIQPKGHPFFIPNFSNNIHYEIELVVKINKTGKNIEEQFAYKYYSEIGIGIDFTARDVQNKCKLKGLPWEISKGFDGSAQICKSFIHKSNLKLDNITFSLMKNENKVQKGNSNKMIFTFDQIISHASRFFTLKIGDLIFTGTPKGVGSVKKGDILKGFIEDKEMLKVLIK